MDDIAVSVVVSVYNEEKSIGEFYAQASASLSDLAGVAIEYIFVDDGSTDGSLDALKALGVKHPIKIIRLSRNFGHEAAMLAGIDHATGDAVICMDADLQHPPSCLPDMISRYRAGYDVVNMIRAKYAAKAHFVKRFWSFLFYKLLNLVTSVKLEENASDFFLVSRRAAEVLRGEYRERTRFLRGFIQIMGFKKTALSYDSPERFGGESKYGFTKLLALSVNALTSFTIAPLRIGIFAGFATGLFGVTVAVYSLAVRFLRGAPPGYTTLVILLCVLFSVHFVLLGIIGEYVGHILFEVKRRPLYLVDEVMEWPPEPDK